MPGVRAISPPRRAIHRTTNWASLRVTSTVWRSNYRHLLRDRQQLAVVEERNRLARDLHDSVKQQMFALTMLVGSAQLEVDEQSEAKRILGEAERIASNAQQEMSALIQALRPVALANKDLEVALRDLCGEWEQRNGIACAVDVPDALTMAPETEQQVFRVVQEALANVAKHSGATSGRGVCHG